MNSKVLVGVPVYYNNKIEQLLAFIEALKNQTHDEINFMFVKNNSYNFDLDMYLQSIQHIKTDGDYHYVNLSYIPNNSRQSEITSRWSHLTEAQNRIIEYAKSNNYEYVMFNEVSRPLHPDTIEQLIRYKKLIIGALYKDTWHPGYYCVYSFDRKTNSFNFRDYTRIDQITEPTKVFGVGFGATLIHRSILYLFNQLTCSEYASDTYFYALMSDYAIPAYAAPIILENRKIDGDIDKLREWQHYRRQALIADELRKKGRS